MYHREITRETKQYFEMNGSENTEYHNLCDVLKAVLRGPLLAVNIYVKKG